MACAPRRPPKRARSAAGCGRAASRITSCAGGRRPAPCRAACRRRRARPATGCWPSGAANTACSIWRWPTSRRTRPRPCCCGWRAAAASTVSPPWRRSRSAPACGCIRPLLPVARARLRATLLADQQRWIDDPSNDDPAHARIRMRKLLPALAAEGLDAARLAATAAHLGRARAAIDDAVADLLAEAAAIFPPAICAWIRSCCGRRRARCRCGPGALPHGRRRAASTLPASTGSNGCTARVRAGTLGGGATLAGCLVVPRRGALLICREPAMATEELLIAARRDRAAGTAASASPWSADGGSRRTRPLGRSSSRRSKAWAAIACARPRPAPVGRSRRLSGPVLPALWVRGGVLAVITRLAAPHRDVIGSYDPQFRLVVAALRLNRLAEQGLQLLNSPPALSLH